MRIPFPFMAKARKMLQRGDEMTLLALISSQGERVHWLSRVAEAYSFVRDEVERKALVESALYFRAHLPSLLQRNDRMGMMHSIESRIPFLENKVLRFALNLPVKYKHPTSFFSLLSRHPLEMNKRVVREIAKGLIPASIVWRKKMGFPVIPESYLDFAPEFFAQGFLEMTLGVKSAQMRELLLGLDTGTRWNFFATEIFGRLFFLNENIEPLSERVLSLARPAKEAG